MKRRCAMNVVVDLAMGAINVPFFPSVYSVVAATFCWTLALVWAVKGVTNR